MKKWGGGAEIGRLYEYRDTDKDRMGSCKWLPSPGDLCLCVAHSGDCFFDYIAIRKQKDGRYKKVGGFGAYCFGKARRKPSFRKRYLLLAGEIITI